MAKKILGKGTILAFSVSSTFTAIPMIISIEKTGEGNQYYDSTTLDGGQYATQENTSINKSPEISAEFFYDPTNAVHMALKTSLRTPSTTIPSGYTSPGQLIRLTYTDSGPLVENWNCVGLQIDEKFATKDGVKSTAKFAISGGPT
ncbi:MAG: hypothetical protein WCH39_01625 [Schlesneria sp.]